MDTAKSIITSEAGTLKRLTWAAIMIFMGGCASIERISYEEAHRLSDLLDIKTSVEDEKKMSDSLETIECGNQSIEFSVIYQLNSDGHVVDTWVEKDDENASCMARNMIGKTFYVPSSQPWYGEIIFKKSPMLTGEKISFEKNGFCNPTIEGSGTLIEAGDKIRLIKAHVKLSNNVSYNEETVQIKHLSLSMQSYYYNDPTIEKDGCYEDKDKSGSWGCNYYGEPLIINKTLSLGEEIEIKDIELVMDISKTKIDRDKWNAVAISVTSDKRIATTGSKVGLLTNIELK